MSEDLETHESAAWAPRVTVHTDPGVDLSGALVLVGMPTLGLVGTITARYLAESLEMPRVGGMHSRAFPPVATIHGGAATFPVRIHARAMECGTKLECKRLVVVIGEFMPGPQTAYQISAALHAWARASGARLLLVIDGYPTKDGVPDEVHGIASSDGSRRFIADLGLEHVPEGTLAGLSGALILDALAGGVDTACLLAESLPDHPDARASANIVALLDKVFPDFEVEHEPLLKRAEEIEGFVRAVKDEIEERTGTDPARPGSMMFG